MQEPQGIASSHSKLGGRKTGSFPRDSRESRALLTLGFRLQTSRIVREVCVCARSVMANSLQPSGLQPTRLLCPWNSPGKNTGVGCHVLLQGIFLTQRSHPYLLHWQADSCQRINFHYFNPLSLWHFLSLLLFRFLIKSRQKKNVKVLFSCILRVYRGSCALNLPLWQAGIRFARSRRQSSSVTR